MLICEDFMAFNWEKASDLGGKITVVSCLGFSVLGLTTGASAGICLYTILVGFLLAILELPVVYFCFPQCKKLRGQVRSMQYIYMLVELMRG